MLQPTRRRFLTSTVGLLSSSAAIALVTACGGQAAAPAIGETTSSLAAVNPAASTSAASSATSTASLVAASTQTGPSATTTQASTSIAAASSAPGSAGPVNLVAVLRANLDEEKIIGQVFTNFQAKNPVIKVEVIEAPSGHYDEKTDALVAGGSPPALWFPAENRGYRYYASRDALQVLDPFIATDKYDLTDFFPVAIDFCKWNGKYVAMPIDLYPQILVYNKTLFANAGIPVPSRDFEDKTWNWSKFFDVSKSLLRDPEQPTAQYGTAHAWNDAWTYSWIDGGDWFEPQGYVTGFPKQFPYQADAVVSGMQFDVDCTFKYHIQPTSAEAKALRGSLPSDFHTGKYGMLTSSPGSFKSLGTITSFEWGVAPMPVPPTLPRHDTLNPDQWATFKGQHSDEAWKLLSYMVGPEGLKVYPTQVGALPSRRSLTKDWATIVKGYTKLTDDDLNTTLSAADHVQVRPSHAVINFIDQIYGVGIGPTLTKLMANQLSASDALAAMTPIVQGMLANQKGV
jgi:multiple sugar transport system substrate-binding protein